MRWLDSITDSMEMNLSKLQETLEDRGDGRAAIHGVTKSWTRLNNNKFIQRTGFKSLLGVLYSMLQEEQFLLFLFVSGREKQANQQVCKDYCFRWRKAQKRRTGSSTCPLKADDLETRGTDRSTWPSLASLQQSAPSWAGRAAGDAKMGT